MLPEFPLPHGQPRKSVPALVLWVVWFAMVTAIPIYQFALGGGWPSGTNARASGFSPVEILAVGQILAATVIRWLVLPKFTETSQQLVMMIIGLALSEAVEFYGIFLVPLEQPETKLALFILSLASVAQFAPIFARPKPMASMR